MIYTINTGISGQKEKSCSYMQLTIVRVINHNMAKKKEV